MFDVYRYSDISDAWRWNYNGFVTINTCTSMTASADCVDPVQIARLSGLDVISGNENTFNILETYHSSTGFLQVNFTCPCPLPCSACYTMMTLPLHTYISFIFSATTPPLTTKIFSLYVHMTVAA